MGTTGTTDRLELYIGNKNFSSWSLRAWLALAVPGIAFEEHLVPFHTPDWHERMSAVSPNGKVPALRHGRLTVSESLAICEYVADRFPEAKLWPDDITARAVARAVSTEMHAGFASLRRECPMDLLRAPAPQKLSGDAQRDVRRVCEIWRGCRAELGAAGPFLFGRFSIADAMFAPVATRFHTYDVGLARGDDVVRSYMRTILDLPAMKRWTEAARAEAGWPEFGPSGQPATLTAAVTKAT